MAYYDQLDATRELAPIGNDGIGSDFGPLVVPGYATWHARPYPTRFHGGIWTRPVFGLPVVPVPSAVFTPTNLNGLAACGACQGSTDAGNADVVRSLVYAGLAALAVGALAAAVNKWVL